jgi:Ca2+/H+ antiporter, TMEM165/GDT1 family
MSVSRETCVRMGSASSARALPQRLLGLGTGGTFPPAPFTLTEYPRLNWRILFGSFGLVFLAELGDKTQLAALAFSAQSQRPWSVFFGTSLALICSTALAVSCGSLLTRIIPPKYLELGAGVMFVVVGLILLVNMARRAPVEQEGEATAHEPGVVSRFVLQQVVPFEADLASFAAAQAERTTDEYLCSELLAVADAHRHHGLSLGTIPCHEQDQLPANAARVRETIERAEQELGESDPVAMVIRKQEAAAEFYISLAGMAKIHAARDVLRDLAAEEIALSQRLCAAVNHQGEVSS